MGLFLGPVPGLQPRACGSAGSAAKTSRPANNNILEASGSQKKQPTRKKKTVEKKERTKQYENLILKSPGQPDMPVPDIARFLALLANFLNSISVVLGWRPKLTRSLYRSEQSWRQTASGDHVREQMQGSEGGESRSKWAQYYPPDLCTAIAKAVLKQWDQDSV